jgi:hypothetical protein
MHIRSRTVSFPRSKGLIGRAYLRTAVIHSSISGFKGHDISPFDPPFFGELGFISANRMMKRKAPFQKVKERLEKRKILVRLLREMEKPPVLSCFP